MTSTLQEFLISILTVFSIFSACHAVLYKRDPRAGFGWVVTCLVFIGIGPCLYWIFGINRIRTHAKKLYRLGYWKHETKTGREQWASLPPAHPFSLKNYNGILNVSERVNRHPLMIGNRLEVLHNGEEAYPAMLKAIEGAQKFIYLCTYIFSSDETGRKFVRALSDAQKRGVKVWVLIDAFGEFYSYPRIRHLLDQEKIKMGVFMPLSFSINSLHFNLRNHRKLLVVDGGVGFTGGMNIRSCHFSKDSQSKKNMTDIHFRVEGPIVLELQEIFLEDWYFATQESLPWLAFPHDLFPGESVCRVVSGGPSEDFEKINCMLLGALAWAQKRVQIMTPYFVPDRVLISALKTAALRGVLVEVLLPEKNNLPFVSWASRALLDEMAQNGVKFYYQPPPFSHGKLFVADEAYALIGSSNWDARSLRLNFELDLEVYDSRFAENLSKHFDDIRSRSREATLRELKNDSFPTRFRNSVFKLFSPYL